jgi:hypothetical protein
MNPSKQSDVVRLRHLCWVYFIIRLVNIISGGLHDGSDHWSPSSPARPAGYEYMPLQLWTSRIISLASCVSLNRVTSPRALPHIDPVPNPNRISPPPSARSIDRYDAPICICPRKYRGLGRVPNPNRISQRRLRPARWRPSRSPWRGALVWYRTTRAPAVALPAPFRYQPVHN